MDSVFHATLWALLPAIIAIVLALITKQVYVSLFAGIFVAVMFNANGNPITAFETLFAVMVSKIGDNWNACILIFLVVLGILVILISKAGGSKAYGDWASNKIKSRSGAMLATTALGALIFIDDYFNCLTIGSVMRPVTDRFKISRAKLAYIIDSTAAPICIIAPISSWAAAVGSSLEGIDGFTVFMQSIPFNLYALLTIGLLIFLSIRKLDFGPMRKFEKNAVEKGDLFSNPEHGDKDLEEVKANPRGKVLDLIIPIAALIVLSITFMLYTGGVGTKSVAISEAQSVTVSAGTNVMQTVGENSTLTFDLPLDSAAFVSGGTSFEIDSAKLISDGKTTSDLTFTLAKDSVITVGILEYTLSADAVVTLAAGAEVEYSAVGIIDAFGGCDAALSLAMGSIFTLILSVIYFLIRRVITFKEFAVSIPEGFKAMVPSILILVFAWTLSGVCNGEEYLNLRGAPQFQALQNLGWAIPAIFFVVSLGIAFSTGTSWGTFALLLPIATATMTDVTSTLFILSVSSVLAGAVCGDHISPISDTTIMASAGAQCNHVDHVNTQLPYALTVAAVCFVTYLIGGLIATAGLSYWLTALIDIVLGVALLALALFVIKLRNDKQDAEPAKAVTDGKN